jgi:hypothetical protein
MNSVPGSLYLVAMQLLVPTHTQDVIGRATAWRRFWALK